MPELPEVETIRRGLRRLIIGRTIVHAHCIDSPKSFPNPAYEVDAFLIGARIIDVKRRAKILLIELSSGYTLVTHLKMTGQLVFVASATLPRNSSKTASRRVSLVHATGEARAADDLSELEASGVASSRWGGGHPNDSLVGELPDKSTRVVIELDGGGKLFFNDQRKFGWMKLLPTIEVPNIDFMRRVGPEPLEVSFTSEMLFERLQRRKNTTIKAALLDQSVVAGIGNIYADESLWGAKIHPATLVRNLPKSIIQTLTSEIKAVLLLSIQKGGSTDRNYIDAEGKKGSYLKFAKVFRREGQACPRCGRTIEKIRVAGRGTHICPSCQVVE